MRVCILFSAILLFATGHLHADTLVLNSGREIVVENCRDDDTTYWCELYGATVGFRKIDVVRLEKDERAPEQSSQTRPADYDVLELYKKGYQLLVSDWLWYKEGDNVVVEGEVRNISGTTKKTIQAVVNWYDYADRFITSKSAHLEINELEPGQITSFRIFHELRRGMEKARILFIDQNGEEIPSNL